HSLRLLQVASGDRSARVPRSDQLHGAVSGVAQIAGAELRSEEWHRAAGARIRALTSGLTLTLALITIAATRSCPSDTPDRLPNGSWGGQHVGLVATDTGATIEYDCAAGTIAGPLKLGANGEFDWTGIHYPGHGGPVR